MTFCLLTQVGDQQSAMFGQCCFNVGDVKCTMGTGMFIDCNTGSSPHTSVAGYKTSSSSSLSCIQGDHKPGKPAVLGASTNIQNLGNYVQL